MSKKTIAILAVQGAFAEHQQMLQRLDVESVLIRNLQDWQNYLSAYKSEERGLILPGGESTAMMKIMRDESLLDPISDAIKSGIHTFGTCAGMILLDKLHLDCMNITVKRNAYGRQLGSFHTVHTFNGIGDDVPMTFIRAPYVEETGDNVDVLSVLDNHIIAVRQAHMLATSFHPELTDDTRVHEYFLSMV